MLKYFFSFLFFQISSFAAIDFSDFDRFQGTLTQEEIKNKLNVFLQKDSRISHYFSLNEDSFILYDAPRTQKGQNVEYLLQLALPENEKKNAKKSRTDLVGVKIAIDPGHFGGSYAHLEERYIDLPPSLERSSPVQFDEGSLSFLTAIYLKILLEKEGAIVMLTRDQIGKGVYREDFFDWLKNNPQLWKGEVSLNKLFRKYYNPLDLHARAEKINAFAPDLSIVIHYNSHHVETEYSSNNAIAANNYNLVFIPGAFCRNELATQESRYEFLRLLTSTDLNESLGLSSSILEQFTKKLNIPTVAEADGANYLNTVCMKINEGIYARNLALTRLIHGPICYGETLIQNNIDECLNLSRTDFVIHGTPCSSRVRKVAEAYFEGIKIFLLH